MVSSRVSAPTFRAILLDWVLPLAVLGALALWMAEGDREMVWQQACYGSPEQAWAGGEAPLPKWIYHYGPLPALIAGIAALAVLVAGYRWPAFRRWRRVSWFALALLVIGPGLITNAILKDHYGRPRPREVKVLGGDEPYERFLQPDPVSDGKSFPCGHATMGFVFFGGWFLARRTRPALGVAFLVGGLAYGGYIGYVRMLQGGHFATDVVAAAMVIWATAAGLYYLLGLHRNVLDPPEPAVTGSSALRRIPWAVKVTSGAALVALVGAVLLATPYQRDHGYAPRLPEAATAPLKLSFTTARGEVVFRPGSPLGLAGQSTGHGAPGSKIGQRNTEAADQEDGETLYRLRVTQYESGLFTELDQKLEVTVPWERVRYFKLECGRGDTEIRLGPLKGRVKALIEAEGTMLTLRVPPGVVVWLPQTGWKDAAPATLQLADPSLCRIGGPRPKDVPGWLELDFLPGPGTTLRIEAASTGTP